MTTALDSSLTAACFLRTNQNALISKATNEFASFCIDNRIRQMAIFTSLAKGGKDPLNSFSIKTNEILYDLSLYYVKQIDSILPCVCSVTDHRRHQNVVRTLLTHSIIASCATFLFLPHFDVICDLLLNGSSATWNPFLKWMHTRSSILRFELRKQTAASFVVVDESCFKSSFSKRSLFTRTEDKRRTRKAEHSGEQLGLG